MDSACLLSESLHVDSLSATDGGLSRQTAVYFFEHTVEYLIVDKTVAFHDLCNAVAGLHEVRINMGKPYHVDVF